MKMKVTGKLRDVTYQEFPGGFVAWGYVSGDIHGRFRDGERIHTSYVKAYDPETKVLTTRNSTYLVESEVPNCTPMPTTFRLED
jgi:hypothetical protein